MRVYEAILRVAAGGAYAPDVLAKARILFECLDEDVLLGELPEGVQADLEDLEAYLSNILGNCEVPEFEIKNYDIPIAIAMSGDMETAGLVASILISMGVHRRELEDRVMYRVDRITEFIDQIAENITLILYERIRKALRGSFKRYFETLGWQA